MLNTHPWLMCKSITYMFFNKHSDYLYDLLRNLYLKMFMYLYKWTEPHFIYQSNLKSSVQNIKYNWFHLFWILDYNLSKNDKFYTILSLSFLLATINLFFYHEKLKYKCIIENNRTNWRHICNNFLEKIKGQLCKVCW